MSASKVSPYLSLVLGLSLLACKPPPQQQEADVLYGDKYKRGSLLEKSICKNFQHGWNCFLRLQNYKATPDILKQVPGYISKLKAANRLAMGFAEKDAELQKAFPKLAPEESQALVLYTASEYKPINSGLRGNKSDWTATSALAFSAASAMTKLSPTHAYKDLVYRSEGVDAAGLKTILENYEVGKLVIEKAFLSTTTNSKLRFGGGTSNLAAVVIYTIKPLSGVRIKEFSLHETEEEVLFPPGAIFKVTNVGRTPNKDYAISVEEVLPENN